MQWNQLVESSYEIDTHVISSNTQKTYQSLLHVYETTLLEIGGPNPYPCKLKIKSRKHSILKSDKLHEHKIATGERP